MEARFAALVAAATKGMNMKMARTSLAALALALAGPTMAQGPAPAAEPVTILHAGTLMAVPGEPPRRQVSVVVRGRRVAEVRSGYVELPGARIVDLRDSTVMPGFIDMHVHLVGLDDRMQSRLQQPFRDHEDEAYTALINSTLR